MGDAEPIEHDHTGLPVCPYCGYSHDDSRDWRGGEHDCDDCGRTFDLTGREGYFTTSVIGRCPTCGSKCMPRQDGSVPKHLVSGTTIDCGGGVVETT